MNAFIHPNHGFDEPWNQNNSSVSKVSRYVEKDGSYASLSIEYDPNHTVEIELKNISPETYRLITGRSLPLKYLIAHYRRVLKRWFNTRFKKVRA